MRLHTLILFAVGPFADKQVIDFDRLSAGGLFLFEGPTGVGKSTILDALTFALYGGLASATSDPTRMRSDFVAEHVRPEVTLEFSVRGHRYRITRNPAFERPRRRGTGKTVEAASVHLQQSQAGVWSSLSHSKAEVANQVGDLLGLSQEQFRKVVLLPQGEFAAFLAADEKDRAAILTTLFGTEMFQKVTEEVRNRATLARGELREADARLRARCAAAWEAAGEVRAAEGAATPAELADLSSRTASINEVAQRAADHATAADEAVQAAAAKRQAAADLLDAVRRHRGLMAQLAVIEQRRDEQETRIASVALAHRAAAVRPIIEQLDEKSTQVLDARSAVVALGLADEEHLAGRGHEALATQANEARDALARIEPIAEIEASLAQRQADLDDAQTQAREAQTLLQTTRETLAALPAAARAAQAAADAAVSEAARTEALRLRIESIDSALGLAARVGELEDALTVANEAVRVARRDHEALDDTVRLLEEHRVANLSGLLAVRLVSGDPCMVCGSPEHPQPAQGAGAQDIADDLRAATAQRDEARIVLDGAREAQIAAQTELTSVRSGLGTVEATELNRDRERLVDELSSASSAQAALPGLQAQVHDLTASTRSLAEEAARLTGESVALAAQVKHLRAGLGADRDVVAAARGEFDSVAAHLLHLEQAAERGLLSAAAVAGLGRVLDDESDLAGRADRECVRAGFPDGAAARVAMLSESDLVDLEAAVAAWQREFEEVDAQLRAPELTAVADVDEASASLADRTAVDVLEKATGEAQRALGEKATAEQRARRFADRLEELDASAKERDLLAASADEVITLDEYVRGLAGPLRMPLVTYVLRYWFDQVVAAANVRLATMSSSKYQLQRTETGARKDARVGLGLAVLDRHTGRERSPGSLSGGEKFYASLSLALGLADVVVSQAGGADLDTLFIDEGFGTLDEDTLECVMSVIDDLRGNGRVVGIVSHVPDLKERIAERLCVRRVSPEGPSRVIVA